MSVAVIEARGPAGQTARCELPTSPLSAARVIGRRGDLRIDWDRAVSSRHAEIAADDGTYRFVQETSLGAPATASFVVR